MSSTTEVIQVEFESNGITDITLQEAYRAWEYASKYDSDHVVVLRAIPLEPDEPLAHWLLEDIVFRRESEVEAGATNGSEAKPVDPAAASACSPEDLSRRISKCAALTLQLPSAEDVDVHVALTDLGMDSVMTVGLRRQPQKIMKIKVPSTLTWEHPTV